MEDQIEYAKKNNPVTITEAGRTFLIERGIDPDSIKTLKDMEEVMAGEDARELKPKPKGFFRRIWDALTL